MEKIYNALVLAGWREYNKNAKFPKLTSPGNEITIWLRSDRNQIYAIDTNHVNCTLSHAVSLRFNKTHIDLLSAAHEASPCVVGGVILKRSLNYLFPGKYGSKIS